MKQIYVNLYLNDDGTVRRGTFECLTLEGARRHISKCDTYICTIKLTTEYSTKVEVAT